MQHTTEELKRFRSKLVENPTNSEMMARIQLNSLHKVDYYKFQSIIGFYIADFVIPCKMLVVEIDGSSHLDKKKSDCLRDKFLNEIGFRVCRIPNSDSGNILKYISKYPDLPSSPGKYRNAMELAKKKKVDSESRVYYDPSYESKVRLKKTTKNK